MIPDEFSTKAIKEYKKQLQKEFGWAHLTLGGTTANIEALWVARTIKFAPLSIWEVANDKDVDLDIELKLPNGTSKDIKKFTKREILSIKVNEAIYLLAKYVDAIRKKYNLSVEDAGKKAQDLLNQAEYGLNKGIGKIFQEFSPVIFVSGMAHYSISKAADMLGIGHENVEIVKADSQYRIDVVDLERKIRYALAQKRIPLAVIAIVGTTEEGSVDPVHQIQDLREKLEEEESISFWLHVDAAWGGYIKSIFNLSSLDILKAVLTKISTKLKFENSENIIEWTNNFFSHIECNVIANAEKNGNEEIIDLTDNIRKEVTAQPFESKVHKNREVYF